MTVEIAMRASGFLFLFILALNLAKGALGKKPEAGEYDSDAKLQKIGDDPKKFHISMVLALIEHVSIIALAILLFVAFGRYGIMLGIVGTIFRTGEGLIHIYNERGYWGLDNTAKQYAGSSGPDREALSDSGRVILQTYDSRFGYAMMLWSIGTLAYSVLFVASGVVPLVFGLLGIAAGVSFGLGYGIRLVRPGSNVLLAMGGASAVLFEVGTGGWLLFSSHTIA